MKTQPTNLFNTMKMVIRGKFIAQNAYIQKIEIVNITNLTTNLKALEQRKKRNHIQKKYSNSCPKPMK